jgi:hypothetical protein
MAKAVFGQSATVLNMTGTALGIKVCVCKLIESGDINTAAACFQDT